MPSGVSYTVSLLLYLYLSLAPQGIFTLLSLLLLPSPLAPQGIFYLSSFILYLPYDRIWY